ncbi:uncharacterized protein EI90DRAFT_2925831 [Cantharellus anzutake]|uniref:uncharacterized protein n=1 Tax=Cantharellus anzutake TaxID=1750568 RepID=UPI001906254D|nr:uncharacterized protein EI90DRAFT_2925831 [Cantharellus anzutake]KAF8328593.1 hypothetical protein EI90DRAFT_2925831 [Cantharellus anzutake]
MPWSQKRRVSHGLLRSDQVEEALNVAITTYESAELAIFHLMEKYEIDWQTLKKLANAKGLDTSFSHVTWEQISPFVGIDPFFGLARLPKFELKRARIPTVFFKSIVQEVDRNNSVYGPLRTHLNEEARSRFIAPVFIGVADLFCSSITGVPETALGGRVATKGRVEHHFVAVGGLTLLVVVTMYKLGTPMGRRNAIAQMVAEADARDYRNLTLSYNGPVYYVLFDGESFTYFKYDHSEKRKFFRGKLGEVEVFRLADSETDPRQFIQDLRSVCEITFSLLLQAHGQALQSLAERDPDEEEGWKSGAKAVEEVLQECLNAAFFDKVVADQLAGTALTTLSDT